MLGLRPSCQPACPWPHSPLLWPEREAWPSAARCGKSRRKAILKFYSWLIHFWIWAIFRAWPLPSHPLSQPPWNSLEDYLLTYGHTVNTAHSNGAGFVSKGHWGFFLIYNLLPLASLGTSYFPIPVNGTTIPTVHNWSSLLLNPPHPNPSAILGLVLCQKYFHPFLPSSHHPA